MRLAKPQPEPESINLMDLLFMERRMKPKSFIIITTFSFSAVQISTEIVVLETKPLIENVDVDCSNF